MRWLLAVLLLRSAFGAEPLLDRESDRAQVVSALEALSRGDASAFSVLPAAVFIASAGVPDPGDPDLIRRWTAAVPIALSTLSKQTRASAIEVLDQRYRILENDASDELARARIAAAFMPAPSALIHLQQLADRAFDHGDLQRYLAIAEVIGSSDHRRNEMALSLLGAGPVVDPSAALSAPGTPTLLQPGRSSVLRTGLTVRWSVVPGWLLALDPWDGVRWQYRLDAKAEVVTGDGGSLVRDGRGLRLVSENGNSGMLPPAPATARLLAVAGGAAWFSAGREVYRIDLDDRHLSSTALPAEPLSSPLVRGADSLWLTSDELVLMHEMTVTHRVRHGLAADQRFSLGFDNSRPLILAGDGRSWQVGALEEQLVHASPAERLALLVRARRLTDAIALFAAEPSLATDPASRRQVLLAHLASGRNHVRGDAERILALTATDQERVTVLIALGRDDEVTTLCAAHPELLIPMGDQAWDADPDSWNHVVTGRAWIDHAGLTAWLTLPPNQRSSIRAGESTRCDDHDLPQRQGDGTWRSGSRLVRCDADLARTTVECRDNAGALRWIHRWPALDALAAPGRSLALRDTWIVLVEGAARLRVLDLGNGELLADLNLQGADIAPETVVPLGSGKVADLGPLGINKVLHLRGDTTVDVPLPVAGRWIVPWGEKVVVALNDGRFLSYPGGANVVLPDELRQGPPPFITIGGLEVSGHRWPWQR